MNKRIFWYRRILTMVAIGLTMVLICTCLIKEQNDEIIATGNGELELYAGGFPVGVYLETQGVLVIGVDTVTAKDGINYEPAYGKVREGDYIVALNKINVSAKSQLNFLVQKYGNEDIILTLKRDEELIDVKITPVKIEENMYRLGVWVRDDSQGIGTMTYVSRDGSFGALGHGISDSDTKELLDSKNGLLYGAKIWGITKGKTGYAGSLCGSINYEKDNVIGDINNNSDKGIYGKITSEEKVTELAEKYKLKAFKTAGKYEVKTGKASILACATGEVKEYEVKITEINVNKKNNRGLVIKITDKELLNLTGGIVQGMSGSPIIQDGKLVGAVTHVLVNEPDKGYGIFIEEMLAQ